MDFVECIIAGGGAIGLAIGRSLAIAGRKVLVIERNADFGLETSGRNSEVIHAGIHYPPGSLKARFCRQGRDMLVDYLVDKAIAHRICGKLIVATSSGQADRLLEIEARAIANGVTSLLHLDRAAVNELEPDLACHSGLLSPRTGIFDTRAYMRALLADIEDMGGIVAWRTTVTGAVAGPDGHVVETCDPAGNDHRIGCKIFINAAGPWASSLARSITAQTAWTAPETGFARGTYYTVDGKTPFRHLVYPVPEAGGLGIHLTLDLHGVMRFGPDVEWVDRVDYRLDDHRREHFRTAISRYWPAVAERDLQPAYCGIRPKLARAGEPDADFLIAGPQTHGIAGLVHLLGIESPGLTSSLAIASHVNDLLDLG